MKHLFLSLLIFILLTSLIQSQENVTIEKSTDYLTVSWSTAVDSNSTVYTKPFSLRSFDAVDWYTYPIHFSKLQSSVKNKPFITVTIEGSDDNFVTYKTVDTVGTLSDSLETLYAGVINCNPTTFGKFYTYRLKAIGTTDNRSDAILKVFLHLTVPDLIKF